jgi:membrane protease YdiL (CAAX protease family)
MSELLKILIRILPFLIIIAVLTLRIKLAKLSKEELGLNSPINKFNSLIWCLSFFVFCVITEVTLFKLGLLEVRNYKFELLNSSLKILGMVIIAPIAEELLYRGLFLSKLLSFKINKHLAVFIIAILFVIVHSFAFEDTLTSKIGIVQVYLDASLFAYARLNTKSIYTPITMHITGNLIATFEMYFL